MATAHKIRDLIARETGLGVPKLQRWNARARPAATVPLLRPVEVVQEPESSQALALIAQRCARRAPRLSGRGGPAGDPLPRGGDARSRPQVAGIPGMLEIDRPPATVGRWRGLTLDLPGHTHQHEGGDEIVIFALLHLQLCGREPCDARVNPERTSR